MSFLLDTNVLSEVTRPNPDVNVLRWLDEVDEDRCFVSVVTLAELRRGIQLIPKGKRKESLSNWLKNDLVDRFMGRIIPLDQTIAFVWGDLLASTKLSGHTMSTMDGWLAATAINGNLTIITRNTKDFQIPDLMVIDPWNNADAQPD